MCLIICPKVHPEYKPLIAGYDILCFKRLKPSGHGRGRKYWSPIQMSRWTPGMKRYGVLDDWRETSVEAGFHAYHEYEHAAYECRFVVERIYPAIIPKGARFFVGLHGDIVSNRMTVYLTEKAALQGRKLGPAQPELHRFAKA